MVACFCMQSFRLADSSYIFEAMQTVFTSSDLPITVKVVKDKVALDISSFEGIICVLYYSDTREVLAKYSLNELQGYEELIVVDASVGELKIRLKSSSTQSARPGKITMELKAQISDTDYDESRFHPIADFEDAFKIKTAITNTVNSL